MEPTVKTYEECLGVHLYLVELHRSSNRRCFKKKVALKNFAKFTGKHLCQSLFSIKVAGLRIPTLLKKRLWYMRFPVNFAKFLRTSFLKNICERMLLVAGWRTTQKLSSRDLLLVTCPVYINISVASFFPFIYLRFFYRYLFWF